MQIEQQILHTTMHVEGITNENKRFTATAFVFHKPLSGNSFFPVLVSNKHVLLSDAKSLKVTALRKKSNGDPDYGHSVKFDLKCSCGRYHIVGHNDDNVDVAAIGIASQISKQPIFHKSISTDNLLDNQPEERGLQKGIFETVLFVGYPNGIFDSHNILPIARFGKIATMLDFDYMGKPQFLIDAAVFGGSSGSPVFVYRHFKKRTKQGVSFGEEPHFVGILAAVHQKGDRGHLVPAKFEVQITKELGLGIVFKQKTVMDVVDAAYYEATHRRPVT